MADGDDKPVSQWPDDPTGSKAIQGIALGCLISVLFWLTLLALYLAWRWLR